MEWIFPTTIIPAGALVKLARQLAAGLAEGDAGAGMWQTPVSADGKLPATHFISSGPMEASMFALLGDVDATMAAAEAKGFTLLRSEVEDLYEVADITLGDPHARLQELGLQLIQPDA